MISIELCHGFRAVPRDAVTLNGIPLPQLNTMTEPYVGKWCLIGANGLAIDSASGSGRPHVYDSLEEAVEDVERLGKSGEYSTCGGVVMPTNETPLTEEEEREKKFYHVAPLSEAMSKKWVIHQPGLPFYSESGEKICHNDTCIVTEGDGLEVVGSSEWLCVKQEILEHIVRLHNFYIEATSKGKQ